MKKKAKRRVSIPSDTLLAIADCLHDEAMSCNDYAKGALNGRGWQADDLYHRTGLLLSIESVLRKAHDHIANAAPQTRRDSGVV